MMPIATATIGIMRNHTNIVASPAATITAPSASRLLFQRLNLGDALKLGVGKLVMNARVVPPFIQQNNTAGRRVVRSEAGYEPLPAALQQRFYVVS